MQNASPKPGFARDQKQPCRNGDKPGGSGDLPTGRREALDGDGCRHDSHRAKVHDPDDKKDRDQIGAATAAMEAEMQAMSKGRAGIRR